MRKRLSDFLQASRRNKVIAVLAVLVVIAAGYLIFRTAAAGFFASVEPNAGVISGNAKVVNDTTASDGKAIQFTAPVVPAPDPTPTPTPTPGACVGSKHTPGGSDDMGGCWPGANNTGVPTSTVLSNYTGPCTITAANTVIDRKTINCSLVVKASGLLIKNSKVNGTLDVDGSSYSATVEDSEITGFGNAGIGYTNITVTRSNIYGAQHSVLCSGNCVIKDSWLHGQVFNKVDSHSNAILSNGGNNMQFIHNTLFCEPKDAGEAGCTADIHMTGDFSAITNVVVDKNLFMSTPGGYCFRGGYETGKPYGKQASNVDVTNNIFKRGSNNKCASFGVVSDYTTAGGGVWSNNKWEDGAVVNP